MFRIDYATNRLTKLKAVRFAELGQLVRATKNLMHLRVPLLIVLFCCAQVLDAASTEKESLKDFRAEVAARKLVREHESETKKATEEQLTAARAVIRKSKERRARAAAPGPDGGFSLTMKDADMIAVAKKWEEVFGGIATAADRIKSKRASISVSDSSLDEFQKKVEAALRQNGVHLIYRPDGVTLDAEPDTYRRK